jgi:hypothetical protein
MTINRAIYRRIATCIATACFVADASGQSIARSEPTRSEQPAAILQQADGQLRQIFSLPFTLDERHLSQIKELESLEVARTHDGGAIRVILERGAVSPTKIASVEYVRDWGVDPNWPHPPSNWPTPMPRRAGFRAVSSFRAAGTERFLITWKQVRSGRYSLVMYDRLQPTKVQPVLAISAEPILAAGLHLWMPQSAESAIVVWTRGKARGQAVISMYTYQDLR